MENTIRTSRLAHRQQRIDIGIEKSENTIRTSLRSDDAHRLKLFTFCLLFAMNAALSSWAMAAQSFDGWRAVIVKSQGDYENNRLPGEGMQYPHSMVRSYSNPDYIYCSHDCGPGFRSTNGGETWQHFLAKGLGIIKGQSIEVDPANPNTVFLSVDNLYITYLKNFQGLYKSTDGGDNWTFVQYVDYIEDNRAYKHNIAYALNSISGGEAKIWYAAFADKGLYKSTDGGDNWVLATGLSGHAPIYALYVHPENSDTLYLGSNGGLYRSTDGGSTLNAFGDLPAGDVATIQILYSDPNIMYVTVKNVGLYKSTNAGANFSLLRGPSYAVGCFINQGYPDVIYYLKKVNWGLDRSGIEVSQDGGENWTELDPATSSHPRSGFDRDSGFGSWFNVDDGKGAIIPNPNNKCEAVGYASAYLWKTTNCVDFYHSNNLFGGYAWTCRNGMLFDSENPNRFGFFGADIGMFISENSGKYFEFLANPSSILMDYGFSSDSRDLKAGAFQPGTDAFVASGGRIWGIGRMGIVYSPDNDGAWEKTQMDGGYWYYNADDPNLWGAFRKYFYDADEPNILYVANVKSTDGGKNYTQISYLVDNELEIHGIAPSDPNIIYAMNSTGTHIYRSVNRGVDWALYVSRIYSAFPTTATSSFELVFDVDPVDCNKIYTVHGTGYPLASYNGSSWNDLGALTYIRNLADNSDLVALSGGSCYPGIASVIVDPKNNSVIYVAVTAPGVAPIYRSTDGGSNWEDISYNLPRIGYGSSLSINPNSGEIFVGGSSGTWVFPPPYNQNTSIYSNSVSVNAASLPPHDSAWVLASIGDKPVNENTLSIFTVKAIDANGDDVANITYSIQNKPSGAEFQDQIFSWTPGYDQAETYTVTFIASDGQAQDSETITITVNNVNRPPVAVDDSATVAQDSGANAIDVLANDLDADGDTLTITAVTQPSHGDAVITGGGTGLTYTPAANYNGSDSFTYTVSDGNGSTDTATVTVIVNPGNQAPSADAGADQTLTDNDGNGSEPVDLHGSGSTDPDGTIESWVWSDDRGDRILAGETTTPTLSVATHTITLTVTDDDGATDTDTVTVTINALDSTAPSVINYSPTDAAAQVPLNNLIILHILDDNSGVDVNSVTIKVNDDVVYTGNTTDYSSAWGHCRRIGTIADFTFVYQADQMFDFDQAINVTVNAADICGNAMVEHSHSFETEMFSFGENKNINADGLSKNYPATVQDSGGNIWAAWHAGATGSRDIYIVKLAAGAGSFAGSIRLTNSAADQCNPAVAIDADDKLYVGWQDNTQGNWDILIRTSADGAAWSAERTVTDSNGNQTNPAIVVDGSLSRNVSVAWQDDRAGNANIYVAVSGNDFVTKTTSQITSHTANQSEPAITADASNTIYVVWTDQRNGSNDIYGASSNIGPWTEVAVVTKSNSQSSPAIAAEQTGSILHLLWVDDTSGDSDIYYASSDGLPGSSLTGAGIVDDTTGADQSQPAIVVTGSTGSSLKVFASWKDERNVSSNGDTDLYLVQIGSDENVFVGDDGTNSNQSKPALGVDAYGYPYLLWADSRTASPSIYYAATTFVQSAALASNDVTASSGATVGTDPAAISSADDVSVIVPAGACSSDSTITISKVENPPKFNLQRLSVPYDFGPSGIEFSQPVTITIPYTVPADGQYASAYWYNPLTGTLSQQGITNVSSTQISPSLYALSFKTTHFSQFIVGGGTVGSDGVSGGGGCSMSPSGQADIREYLLPYIALAAVMLVLKLRDARRRRLQSTIRGGR